jgi:hypothetical protein
VALDNHRIFFHLQRDDGYLPCWVWAEQSGKSQIQMVVPIARTAWEVFRLTADEGFLVEAYDACSRWDAWLARYHNTLGTGLCEAFCEYDTGHDNSPRFAGLPHESRDGDARWCPDAGKLPYVAPDLSATVYGGRRALAMMARQLGREAEARDWDVAADATRKKLLDLCFDPESECFYDRNRDGEYVRIRGDVLSRVLCEHVVDQAMFDRIYQRHLRNPQSFWTPYPLPSIAADDPAFVRSIPPNSWGGASQALTALRAPRWFGHYGKHADLTHLMRQWVKALLADDGFRQQMNPWTGVFTAGPATYSPAMLVFVDYIRRLCGPVMTSTGVEWNCGTLPGMVSGRMGAGNAEIRYDGSMAKLFLEGHCFAQVQGMCRVVTDASGTLKAVVGSTPESHRIHIRLEDGNSIHHEISPDTTIDYTS